MINISELAIKIENEGYSEENAEAKLCQDIILLLLSKSRFNKNITIKGGVVMRSISNDVRRATIDLDLDFIRYPLTEERIKDLISQLNGIEGIKISIIGNIEDLKHQDYKGKRVFVDLEDQFNNHLSSKIDVGVHKYMSIEQDDYCFDISFSPDGAALLINSKEQMLTEKLKSLLKFGSLSTRFKDIYDIYYLVDLVDKDRLMKCFDTFIFQDPKARENDVQDILLRIEKTFADKTYLNSLYTSNKNWVGVDNQIVLEKIKTFIKNLNK